MTTQLAITLVAALLAFVASIIATFVAAYNGRFAKFARQKWWEKQAEVYARIVEALAGMVYYHEEHLTAYEEGRNIPAQLKAETDQHWQRSYAELKKASAVGAFLISEDGEAALRKMWKEKDKPIDPQDWYGQLEQDYKAARDCLKSMVDCAKRDLETDRRPTQLIRLRPFIAIVVAIVVTVAGTLWGFELRNAKRWPFSTGTTNVAFLGTTFGMSPQEASRALAGFGAQLLTLEEYRGIEQTPHPALGLPASFVPLFSDDRIDNLVLIMPGIEMFQSKVEAEFHFRHERLQSVSVYFDPVSPSAAETVVSSVDSRLRAGLQLARREESKEIPGAYTLHYVSPSGPPSLWVNLTDREQPIIILTVVDPTRETERRDRIQSRQQSAFE